MGEILLPRITPVMLKQQIKVSDRCWAWEKKRAMLFLKPRSRRADDYTAELRSLKTLKIGLFVGCPTTITGGTAKSNKQVFLNKQYLSAYKSSFYQSVWRRLSADISFVAYYGLPLRLPLCVNQITKKLFLSLSQETKFLISPFRPGITRQVVMFLGIV